MCKLHYTITKIFILFTLILCGCDKEPKIYKIGVSQCSTDNWREQINIEMQQEVEFYKDMTLEFKYADSNNKKQIAQIEEFIEEAVDLIIVIPNEEMPLTPVIERAYEKGIKIIIVDTKINSNKYNAFLGADNFNIGEMVGQYISTFLDGNGTIIELSGETSSTVTKERHIGLLSSLSQYQDIKIYNSINANWSEQRAQHITDSLLRIKPNIDVIFAHNDQMAYGAYKAAHALGRDDQIKVIGIDGLAGKGHGLDLVSKGYIDVTFLYPTFGHIVIRRANQIIHDKTYHRSTKFETAMIDRVNARVELLKNSHARVLNARIKRLSLKLSNHIRTNNIQQSLLTLAVIIIAISLIIAIIIVRMMMTIRNANTKLLNQKEKLEKQHKQLKQLSKNLEEATNAKLVFFTNISHDFKTPLTLIADPINYLLKDTKLDIEQRELLTISSRNVNILLRLMTQILDFRCYENHKLNITPTKCNLYELVKEWCINFTSSITLRGEKISLEVLSNYDYELSIDTEMIERVYFNLLSNAIKYSTSDTITVKLSIRNKEDKRFVCLSLSNYCDTISQEVINNIFDRFYKIDGSSNGSGIGLAIAKCYIELHKGYIEAKYSDSQLTVTIYLPTDITPSIVNDKPSNKVQIHEFTVTQQPKPQITTTQNCDDRPLLLVVDDNDDIRQYIRILLQNDYQIIDATDGQNGVDIATKQIPDIIISDVMMDGMDGMELCRCIKKEPLTCHIPVLLLTACSDDEKRIEGYANGADGYIAKPFNQEVLRTRLGNLIRNRKLLLSTKDRTKEQPNVKEDPFLEKFNIYLDMNLGNSALSSDDIGRDFGYSKSQLYRKIKAITGDSPNKLLRIRRLQKSKDLLQCSTLTISEIAYEVGFSSPSYFTKSYREYYGETPSKEELRHT